MGNKQSQRNEISHLELLTREQLEIYEPNCRPDPNRQENQRAQFFGYDVKSETGFIDTQESLFDVVQRDHATVMKELGNTGHHKLAFWLICLQHMVDSSPADGIIADMNTVLRQEGHPESAQQWFADLHLERFAGSEINCLGNQGCPFWKSVQAIDNEGRPIFSEDGKPGMDYALHCCKGGVDYEFWHLSDPTRRLKVSSLSMVMVWNHHFYEGNVQHRLNPFELIKFIN